MAKYRVISGLTCKRGERVNSALCIDPFASFVWFSKQKNIQLTAGLTPITAIDPMWKMLQRQLFLAILEGQGANGVVGLFLCSTSVPTFSAFFLLTY